MKVFYHLLINTLISSITNLTVWFALTYFAYLQTHSVLTTSIMSGGYLLLVAVSGFWLGSIVDHHRKKPIMLVSSAISLALYSCSFVLYTLVDPAVFTRVDSPMLWVFVVLLLIGVLAGNLRSIALPTLVTVLIPAEQRDKANGLVGSVFGTSFLIVSAISGFLVGWGGMFYVFLIAITLTIVTILHLLLLPLVEKKIVHDASRSKKIDLKGTLVVVRKIPGLLALILFTTCNNFLGGIFMSLMDAYGLSLVSVQVWGLLWAFLSTGFIMGGLIIAKVGLGKNPLRSMFLANIVIWCVSCVFTLQPSIGLLTVGSLIYLTVVPFIEAAEQTIVQKLVPHDRQGRVFGFSQSVEQAASPLTAFLIGPITQFAAIPFMTDGLGAQWIGSWFGTGPDRGIALVFTAGGIVGLVFTLLCIRSKYYRQLSTAYLESKA
ncbi:MFS transporter [Candidatus Gracilibacteria bacterium]|nr:MFS transporter [Candidatus Gracilibacteria bacterium]